MLIQHVQPFIHWLHSHPEWACLVVFFVAFAESVAIIGTIIPGSVMMTAVGGLAGLGIIPVWTTILWAILGAILGDNLSFYLGTRCKDRIDNIWPFTHFPSILEKGRGFFNHYGTLSVFVGRFVGVVRAIVPVVAGSLGLPVSRYLPACILSAIIWAPLYLLPGFLLGAASQSLPPLVALRLILTVLVIIFCLWLLYWILCKVLRRIRIHTRIGLWHLSKQIQKRPSMHWLSLLTNDANASNHSYQLLAALVFLVSSICFALLTISVYHHGIATTINLPVRHLFRDYYIPFLKKACILMSLFGEKKILLVIWFGLLIWLCIKKQWLLAIHWFIAFLLAGFSIEFFKHFIAEARPSHFNVIRHGFSYPSGHATLVMTFFGFFAVLAAKGLPAGKKHLAYWLAFIVVLLVDFSRVYLGAHWLCDVIAGNLLGLACLSLTMFSLRHWTLHEIPVLSMSVIAVIIFLPTTTLFCYKHFHQEIWAFTPLTIIHTMPEQTWWQQATVTPVKYRHSCLGSKVETLNLEWLGELKDIKQTLKQHGWRALHHKGLSSLLTRTRIMQNKHLQQPLLNPLYQHQKPVLIRYLILHAHHQIHYLQLYLWRSQCRVNNSPLWVGIIRFRGQHHFQLLPIPHQEQKEKPHLQPVTFLLAALSGDTWTYQRLLKKDPMSPTQTTLTLFIRKK